MKEIWESVLGCRKYNVWGRENSSFSRNFLVSEANQSTLWACNPEFLQLYYLSLISLPTWSAGYNWRWERILTLWGNSICTEDWWTGEGAGCDRGARQRGSMKAGRGGAAVRGRRRCPRPPGAPDFGALDLPPFSDQRPPRGWSRRATPNPSSPLLPQPLRCFFRDGCGSKRKKVML
jgi:hypothetical protein